MNKAAIPLIIFLVLVGLFWFVLGQMNQGEYNPRDIPTEFIGRSAPEFNLPDLLKPEKTVSPSQYQGKAWLLNVWGSWCAECWREHDFLLQLKQQGIPIVGLNWRDEKPDALNMLQRLGNPFIQIGYDPNSSAVIDWGVYGAPETFLIDAQGIIRVKHKGGLNAKVWQNKFSAYFKGNG
jgi:cytochrome c biogenesis protein CcmG/thiol:disulfide interchange protein DsbE